MFNEIFYIFNIKSQDKILTWKVWANQYLKSGLIFLTFFFDNYGKKTNT